MTKREMFEVIVNGNVTEEVVNMAKNEIIKLDERNEKRRNTLSKTAKENEPIKEAILGILTDVPMVASDVAEKVGISTQKASALLRQIDGLNVTEVKVKGKGKVKGYALAQSATHPPKELVIPTLFLFIQPEQVFGRAGPPQG